MKLSSELAEAEVNPNCCPGKWQQSICRGNTEFTLKFFGNAILLYNQALDQALHDFKSTSLKSPDQAISQVLIAQFNLADSYIALEEYDRACDYYIAALDYLIKISQFDLSPTDSYMSAVMHAFGHAKMLWADFLKKHGNKVNHSRLGEFHQAANILCNKEIQIAVRH